MSGLSAIDASDIGLCWFGGEDVFSFSAAVDDSFFFDDDKNNSFICAKPKQLFFYNIIETLKS